MELKVVKNGSKYEFFEGFEKGSFLPESDSELLLSRLLSRVTAECGWDPQARAEAIERTAGGPWCDEKAAAERVVHGAIRLYLTAVVTVLGLRLLATVTERDLDGRGCRPKLGP